MPVVLALVGKWPRRYLTFVSAHSESPTPLARLAKRVRGGAVGAQTDRDELETGPCYRRRLAFVASSRRREPGRHLGSAAGGSPPMQRATCEGREEARG